MTTLKRRSFIADWRRLRFALRMMSEGRSLAQTQNAQRASTGPFDAAHSTPTTELNTAAATAIISLRGLGMGCFGTYKGGAVLFEPRSSLRPSNQRDRTRSQPSRKTSVPINSNIRFEVINPVRRGVFRYENGTLYASVWQ